MCCNTFPPPRLSHGKQPFPFAPKEIFAHKPAKVWNGTPYKQNSDPAVVVNTEKVLLKAIRVDAN